MEQSIERTFDISNSPLLLLSIEKKLAVILSLAEESVRIDTPESSSEYSAKPVLLMSKQRNIAEASSMQLGIYL